MPTIMIIMWIVSALTMLCVSFYFWLKRKKKEFEFAGVMFLVCAALGFIAGWLLLAFILYILIMEQFDTEENGKS